MARDFWRASSIPFVIGCVFPSMRRVVRSVPSSISTLSRSSSSVRSGIARCTDALRWDLDRALWDDGERPNIFEANFTEAGYQAKGYFGFDKPEYPIWGHKWAVGTRAELDAAGWAEESFPNEDADY